MSSAVVEFDNITKTYETGLIRRQRLHALAGVSFRVEAGQVCGVVGPNRAGKTTLVKLLLTLCRPTAGRIARFGAPGSDRRTLARIGYVHENQAFPRYLSATELLHYYGTLSLLPESHVKQRVPQLLEMVGLADRGRESVARFSKGMTQRLALALALLGDHDLLVLDEPNAGLDQAGRLLLRDIIIKQREAGRTVLLVSHQLGEVERICDRLLVLAGGRLVYAGPVSGLTQPPAGESPESLDAALARLFKDLPTPEPPVQG